VKGSTVAAALVFVSIAAIPFRPWSNARTGWSSFEVDAESDHAGLAKLYYDVGRGFSEADSALQRVDAGHPGPLRFALPAGTLRALRYDPLDRDGRIKLGDARIVDRAGQVLARLGPERFHPAHQIRTIEVADGGLVLATDDAADHPEVNIDLAAPIDLPRTGWWKAVVLGFAALLAILYAIEAAVRSPRARLGERARSLWKAAQAAPGRAILVAAAASTLAANYPVVFAGKSLLSPNLGTALLYGQLPWVPGFQSLERGNSNSADIDALMWAHLPYSIIQHRALLRDGELPLWNRYNSAGASLFGQGQTCLGDPLQLIPLLAGGAPWAWDLKFLLAKWLLAGGVGFSVWRLTRHLPASLLMAVSAEFVGLFVYRVNHPAIFSFCYAPWILYFWLRYADSRSARSAILWMAALIGANLAELCSGTVKEAYVLLLGMGLSGLALLIAAPGTPAVKRRLLGGAVAGGALCVMIGTPAWYTFYWTLKASYTSYNAPQAFQIQPGMFVGLFDELFYRPFQIFANVINPSANFFILIGLLWAAVAWRSVRANRSAVALAISSLPALLVAFGAVSPGAITRVPFLGNILHIDNTFSCVLIIVFALLAGVGWKEAWERLGSAEGRRESVLVVVLLASCYAIYLGTAQAIVRSAYFDQTWGKLIQVGAFVHGYGLSLLAAAALLTWTVHRARKSGAWTPALLLCALLAFAMLHWRLGLQAGMAFPDYVIMPASRVDLRAPSPTVEAIREKQDAPFRVTGFVDSFFPGWSAAYDLEGIGGPDALVNRYYRQFMDASGIERVWDWRYKLEDKDLIAVKPFLDAMNVRFYLDYPGGQRGSKTSLQPFRSLDMEAYESPSFWPRAFFTDSAAVYADLAQYCSWIKAGDGRPFAAVQHNDWVRLDPAPRVSGDLATRRIVAARDYRLSANTTSFTVSATGPGFIVLNEAYERINFHATLNGAEVPYLRINQMFKGVYVDSPGEYRVEFRYWPRDFTVILAVFGTGLALGLAGVLTALFALKPAPDAGPLGA
jgi:hypothetical protein